MARKVRVFVQNLSQHILLTAFDELTLFKDKSDYEVFLDILKDLVDTHEVDVHAYVLLPKCFEFVATAVHEAVLPRFMQSLGRRYVGYYNKKYSHKGTIWEGRYKASIVEDEKYLLKVMSYIERLASMDYLYSSIGKNLYTKEDGIITFHKLYKKMAYTNIERANRYKTFFL